MEAMIKKYLKYLNYVLRHKYYVFIECAKERILWRGLVHDLSKFLPSEFFPYANYFYGEEGSDIRKGRDETGYYNADNTGDEKFDYAWLLHQKRNKHHWQYWVLPMDNGGFKILEMPLKYRKEMLCDWKGAGRAQGTPNTRKWYEKNQFRMQLGSKTREWIETELESDYLVREA